MEAAPSSSEISSTTADEPERSPSRSSSEEEAHSPRSPPGSPPPPNAHGIEIRFVPDNDSVKIIITLPREALMNLRDVVALSVAVEGIRNH